MACDRNTYKQYTYTSEVRTFNGSDRLNIWYIDAINRWPDELYACLGSV